MNRLQNKVAIVTASTKGIGLATVEAFAKEGATVYMAVRNVELGSEIANKINADKVKVVYFDVAVEESYETMVDQVLEKEGRIDVLVNNFGGTNPRHDRDFMNGLVTKIIEVSQGSITSFSGNYDFYLASKELRMQQLESAAKRQSDMLEKEKKFIAKFAARASHAAQVQSRVKQLAKIERVEPPKRRQSVLFDFPPAPRSGEDVVSIKGVHKRYGSRVIYEGLDFHVRRRERWCIMGVNGAGKSTLLKLIAGTTEPDLGMVNIGASVKMGYFAQHAMDLLTGERTVFETLEDAFPKANTGSLKTLAGCFGFSGDDVEKRCRVLSGGEKARLVMALMLYDPPNLLVLDEPTNHLDMATKEMLIRALGQYEGTMLFVSHDRHFLAALSNRVLELTPEGIHAYGGGYTEYVARTGHEAPGLRS